MLDLHLAVRHSSTVRLAIVSAKPRLLLSVARLISQITVSSVGKINIMRA